MRTGIRVPRQDPKESFMNQQPVLHNVDVRCASCGTSFEIRSTTQAMSIDICSTCHPAYTGRERAVATGGRIDRFNKRRALAAA
jgi:large subunit ribosomal protein L31